MSEIEQAAENSEIICAARKIGPTEALPLGLSDITLQGWTAALLKVIESGQEGGSSSSKPVPVWLAIFCLRQLGITNLEPQSPAGIKRYLTTPNAISQPGMKDFQELLSAGLWQTDHFMNYPAMVVIRNGRYSLIKDWKTPPKKGFVLVVSSQQMRSPALQLLVPLFPGPPIVGIEQPPDSPAEQEILQEVIREKLPVGARKLWIYPQATNVMNSPSIVGPKSIDDLFDERYLKISSSSA